eukprot:c24449_g1_i1 orf=528-809(-)
MNKCQHNFVWQPVMPTTNHLMYSTHCKLSLHFQPSPSILLCTQNAGRQTAGKGSTIFNLRHLFSCAPRMPVGKQQARVQHAVSLPAHVPALRA